MTGIKWKVCGLRDNILDVAALQPDYVGFIFYQKSPRYVGEYFEMPKIIDPKIKKVGVFVNAPMDFVYNTSKKFDLDYVQLHGSESPEYCEKLKKKQIKIIKAFQIDEAFDFDTLKEYETVIDLFLFDTKTQHYGGSGESFDWRILQRYSLEKEYFLSGGLGLDNIEEIDKLDLNKVHAVDVNSKFEITPGQKNIALLKKLNERIERLSFDK